MTLHRIDSADPLLVDHVVLGEGLFPGVGFLAIAVAEKAPKFPFKINQAQWLKPLNRNACPVDLSVESVGETVSINGADGPYASFSFCADTVGSRQLREKDLGAFSRHLSHAEIYTTFFNYGLAYRGSFRALKSFDFDAGSARASIDANGRTPNEGLDTGLLDAAIQGALLHNHLTTNPELIFVPFSVAELIVHAPVETTADLILRRVAASADGNSIRYDVTLLSSDGSPLVELIDLCVKAYNSQTQEERWSIAASFTAEPLEAPLSKWARDMGAKAKITFAPYNQVFQQLLTPDSLLTNANSDARFLLLRLEDLQNNVASHLASPSKTEIASTLGESAHHHLPNGLQIAHLRAYETNYLYDEIFVQKTYAKEGLTFPDDAVVIDIGANIGMFSLFAAGFSKNARIFACEPSPVTFDVLEKNLKLYAPGATPLPIGIAEEDGEAEFTFYPESSVFSGFHAEDTEDREALRAIVANEITNTDRLQGAGDSEQYLDAMLNHRLKRETYTCQLRSVSSLIAEQGLERVDLLKVDAEKCELQVLAGISEADWPKIKQIVVEVHDKTRNSLDEVEEILRSRGFKITTLEEHALENSGLFNVYGRKPDAQGGNAGVRLQETLADLAIACSQAATASKTPLVLALCPPSPSFAAAIPDEERQQLEAILIDGLAGNSAISVLRLEDFSSIYGWGNHHDAQRDAMGRIPYRPEFFEAAACLLARRLHLLRRPPYKVIALDCDNTLWAGVVGEAGVEGIEIPPPYKALQEFVLARKNQGLLLCLVSKNDEESVLDVFEQRGDMVLRRTDIAATRINWEPKSSNLRALSQELNLGSDSFIFLDDNPVECAEVKSNCPEILTLRLPENSADIPGFLERVWAFDTAGATIEDANRTELYKQNSARNKSLSEALTFDDFLGSLNLAIEIEPAKPEDYARLSQLTSRTNQFNIHKAPLDQSSIASEAERSDGECLAIRVTDKFGDYGLCGLVIFEDGAGFIDVKALLLSCRVLGRGVEHALLAKLGTEARARGFTSVRITFVPSAKNQPMETFLHAVEPSEAIEEETQTRFIYDANDLALLAFDPKSLATTPAAQPATGSLQSANSDFMQSTGLVREQPQKANYRSRTGGGNNRIQDLVLCELSDLLNVSPDDIDCATAFTDFGLDSLGGIDLVVRLNDALDILLPPSTLFDYTSVDALCAYLRTEHALEGDFSEDMNFTAREETQSASKPRDAARKNDIAIIGFSGRFPGAVDVDAFWDLLAAGRSAISEAPRMLWDGAAFEGNEAGAAYCTKGGFIADMARFDAEFFGISKTEAKTMDPQQRLFLQESYRALEQAGCAARNEGDGAWGVYVGSDGGDYDDRLKAAGFAPDGDTFIGNDASILAARIAYFLNLKGGAVALDTACSSSLAAVHMGCRDLVSGDLDLVVAGGVSVRTTPKYHILCSQRGMLAQDGVCRPFDDNGNGFVIGDAVGAVVLKRLADALNDGDPIHGVIRGSALNQDGATNGITASNSLSQTALLRRTYSLAGIDPVEIGYIETHGTGTPLGDSIEVQALANAFGAQPAKTVLGSVKGNVGHCLHAAGITSLIKLLLCLRHKKLPPTINHNRPSRHIDFAKTPFQINGTLSDWPARNGAPLTGAVSALGFNGTNVHMVVEEAPQSVQQASSKPVHLITLSAQSEEALMARIRALLRWLDSSKENLPTIALSLASLPSHSHRIAFSAATIEELRARLSDLGPSDIGIVARPNGPLAAVLSQAYKGVRNELENTADVARYRELIELLGAIFQQGHDFSQSFLYPGTPRRTALPSYPFGGDVYWVDAAPDVSARHDTTLSARPFRAEPATAISTSEKGTLENFTRSFIAARLNLSPMDIPTDVGFLPLGLASLDLLQMTQALEAALTVQLSPSVVFDHFTIATLVAYLEEKYGTQTVSFHHLTTDIHPPDKDNTTFPLTRSQQGLWSLQASYLGMSAYNVPLALRVPVGVAEDRLASAFSALVSRWPVLGGRVE
ncbi:MAG: FkbM family methyltransferase, partial [Rhodospirillaceae bacterium]|nr:FkbM family methyltransferase [Rhodospirillaceae bacterium]